MIGLFLIKLGVISSQLSSMVNAAISDTEHIVITDTDNMPDLRNKKIIFAVELDKAGISLPILTLLSKLCGDGEDSLSGSIAGLLIHSSNELYTKSFAQNFIFTANQLGCRFPGHPIVEATGSLVNFLTWKKQTDMSAVDICIALCKKLGQRISNDNPVPVKSPNILALHSSFRKTSNTLELWHMTSKHLTACNITELHVENGDVLDCKGCSYKTCIHYSMQNSCFYGGIMINDILPALEKSDAVVWICPNYNDSISANLTAVINRLTALYRKISFYNKTMFSVIVSGNSGSDSVAKQLIGALNINKGFSLPPYFAIMATANDKGQIKKVVDIQNKAKYFAKNMIDEIKA